MCWVNTATDYARTLSDCNALTPFLIQLATRIDQCLTKIGPRHQKNECSKICVGSIKWQPIMPEPGQTTSIFVYLLLWRDKLIYCRSCFWYSCLDTNWSKTQQKCVSQDMCWVNNGNWLYQNPVELHPFRLYIIRRPSDALTAFWYSEPTQWVQIGQRRVPQ